MNRLCCSARCTRSFTSLLVPRCFRSNSSSPIGVFEINFARHVLFPYLVALEGSHLTQTRADPNKPHKATSATSKRKHRFQIAKASLTAWETEPGSLDQSDADENKPQPLAPDSLISAFQPASKRASRSKPVTRKKGGAAASKPAALQVILSAPPKKISYFFFIFTPVS